MPMAFLLRARLFRTTTATRTSEATTASNTTFSAFGLETVHLLRRGEPWIAAAYAAASVVVCVAAVWIGLRLVELLPRHG